MKTAIGLAALLFVAACTQNMDPPRLGMCLDVIPPHANSKCAQ